MSDAHPPPPNHDLKKSRSVIKQYAALNILDRVRSGDLQASLKVSAAPRKAKPFQINFDDIETPDDVWDTTNLIYNAVLSGQITLPIAEFALARLEEIGETINHNLEVERKNAEHQADLENERKVFPKKLKEYEAIDPLSPHRIDYRSRNPLFAELLAEHRAKRNQDEEEI